LPATFRPEHDTDELGFYGDLLDLLDTGPPRWHADALCKEAPESITWFPGGKGPNAGARAKAVCATCLAHEDCLAWALDQGPDLDGIWAGTTQRDRRSIRSGKVA